MKLSKKKIGSQIFAGREEEEEEEIKNIKKVKKTKDNM